MAGRSTRQQSKQDQSRAKWTVSLTKILADLMAEQVLKGNRPNNSFGKKAWKCICDGFHKETGLKWDKEQLKNRYGVLRRQYVTIKSLLDQSDFSWDEPRRTVIATDEVWDKYIQTHPDAETIRNNGCPIYRQLCTIFSESGTNGGYDHSSHQVWDGGAPSLLPGQETGSMSIDPGAASIALDDSSSESEEHIDMLDVQNKHQSATPTSGRRKRNRKGIDDVIAEAILEIAVASKLRTTALTQSSEQFSISNCIKALDEIQGIGDRIYFAALDLFDSSSARETFLSLKNDKRLTWLKGKCDAPSTSTV